MCIHSYVCLCMYAQICLYMHVCVCIYYLPYSRNVWQWRSLENLANCCDLPNLYHPNFSAKILLTTFTSAIRQTFSLYGLYSVYVGMDVCVSEYVCTCTYGCMYLCDSEPEL